MSEHPHQAAERRSAERRSVWLIEWPGDDNMPTRYWHPDTGWMLDPHKGCWFLREDDAKAFAKRERLSFTRVVEHKFGLSLTAAPEEDHYPSHEALVELVFLLNSRPHVNDHAFTERWERAVREAEELVRVEP